MINLPYMGLITIRLMNAPTNHVPANPQHVHTPISDDEQPVLSVIYAGHMWESPWFPIKDTVVCLFVCACTSLPLSVACSVLVYPQ